MSPRPRTVSDEAILAALGRVLGRVGPAKLTLASIAKEAGLSASTLVQRFGSKRKLLVRLGRGAGDAAPFLAKFRDEGLDPLEALVETLLCYAMMAPDATTYVHHLSAYLQLDLADPVLRRYVAESGRRNETLFRAALEQAVKAGAIAPGDTKALARALSGLVTGSLVQWATLGTGTARAWLKRDLEVMLGPRRRQGRTTVT